MAERWGQNDGSRIIYVTLNEPWRLPLSFYPDRPAPIVLQFELRQITRRHLACPVLKFQSGNTREINGVASQERHVSSDGDAGSSCDPYRGRTLVIVLGGVKGLPVLTAQANHLIELGILGHGTFHDIEPVRLRAN